MVIEIKDGSFNVRFFVLRAMLTADGMEDVVRRGSRVLGLETALDSTFIRELCWPQIWWSKAATTAAHAGMGCLLYWRARRTDLESSKSIYDCYMFVWRLFYVEYLLLPLFR